MKNPRCQWSACGKEMRLANETPDAWLFVCGCGCVRVLVKDSVRDEQERRAISQHLARVNKLCQHLEPKRSYSFAK
jgi:hypothetical protein